MIRIQIGIILFLVIVLIIVYLDEQKRRILSRKSAKLNRFWNGGKERRKTIRINTALDVSYETVSGDTGKRRTSITRDISLGGINLALGEKFLPGTSLSLQLNLPNSSKPILTQGEIVWVKEISGRFTREGPRSFATGIKFTRLSPENEAMLREFIKQKITDGSAQNTI